MEGEDTEIAPEEIDDSNGTMSKLFQVLYFWSKSFKRFLPN